MQKVHDQNYQDVDFIAPDGVCFYSQFNIETRRYK